MKVFFLSSLLIQLLFTGCSKSEKLTDDEQQYVALSIGLMKARYTTTDSLTLHFRLDSVFRVFHSDTAGFRKQTEQFVNAPGRSELVFRAINDSLHGN
ncbi:MAG TPA: hypothetical protein VEW28_03230 [Candidatus Kapabacteria bacterium]|nr:hypothetical protein [Candidatus Kapabacteria bacterium]